MKKFLFLLIIILGVLAFTNPSKEDFTVYTKHRLEERIKDSGDDPITDFVAENLPDVAEGVVNKLVKRQNFVFCSVYELDMGRKSYRYLGIATVFVPLQKERPLE